MISWNDLVNTEGFNDMTKVSVTMTFESISRNALYLKRSDTRPHFSTVGYYLSFQADRYYLSHPEPYKPRWPCFCTVIEFRYCGMVKKYDLIMFQKDRYLTRPLIVIRG